MYAQVKKANENKSRAVANSATQMKNSGKQCFRFFDNRASTVTQRLVRLQSNSIARIIQRDPDDISMSSTEGALLGNYKRKVINDEGMKKPNTHSKKLKNIKEILTK